MGCFFLALLVWELSSPTWSTSLVQKGAQWLPILSNQRHWSGNSWSAY